MIYQHQHLIASHLIASHNHLSDSPVSPKSYKTTYLSLYVVLSSNPILGIFQPIRSLCFSRLVSRSSQAIPLARRNIPRTTDREYNRGDRCREVNNMKECLMQKVKRHVWGSNTRQLGPLGQEC